MFARKFVIVYTSLLLVIIVVSAVNNGANDYCPNVKKSISNVRKRRHIAFSNGSIVFITIELSKVIVTHVPSGWAYTLDLDVFYPLPDANFTVQHAKKKLHHRQKRLLWETIHKAMDLHNFNGHACVLRSICEAKAYLAPKGTSLVHDLLRAVFTVPSFEQEFEDEIKGKYDEVFDPDICDRIIDCPVSLIHFFFELNKPK